VLDRNGIEIKHERPARKEPLDDREAAALLRRVSTVTIARGKRAESFPAKQVEVDQLKGPTGNYRAPLIVKGKRMLVGFSADTLAQWFD